VGCLATRAIWTLDGVCFASSAPDLVLVVWAANYCYTTSQSASNTCGTHQDAHLIRRGPTMHDQRKTRRSSHKNVTRSCNNAPTNHLPDPSVQVYRFRDARIKGPNQHQ
jgi:7-keto-8-aminopelargonate synthetase-like enzyme